MDNQTINNTNDCQSVDLEYYEDTVWEPFVEGHGQEGQITTTLSSKQEYIRWEKTRNEETILNSSNQLEAVVDKSKHRLLFDVNSNHRHYHDGDVLQGDMKAKEHYHKRLGYVPPLTKVSTINYDVGPLGIVNELWNIFEFSLLTNDVSKRLSSSIAEINIYLNTIVALEKNERNVLTDVQPLDVFENGTSISFLKTLQLDKHTCVSKELKFINNHAKHFISLLSICEEYIKTRNNRLARKEGACYQHFSEHVDNLDQVGDDVVSESIAKTLNDCVTFNSDIEDGEIMFSDIDTILWSVLDKNVFSEDEQNNLSYALIEYFYTVAVMVFMENQSNTKGRFLGYLPEVIQGFQKTMLLLTHSYRGQELLAMTSGYEAGLRLFLRNRSTTRSTVGITGLGICGVHDVICLLVILLAVFFKGYDLECFNKDQAFYTYLSEYFDSYDTKNSFRFICQVLMEVPVFKTWRQIYKGLHCQLRLKIHGCLSGSMN